MKMRKFTLAVLLVFTVLFMVHSEACAKLPKDFQDFKARYENEAETEEGALQLFFEAVFCYLKTETRDEASKMLRYALHLSQPIERLNTMATFVERMKDESLHHIFKSYAVGATPQNSYKMSPDNFKFEVTKKTTHPDKDVTVFIRSSGADSPRPVRMRKYDGLWYTTSIGSVISKVREPKTVVDAKRDSHDADYDPDPVPEEEKTPEIKEEVKDEKIDDWGDFNFQTDGGDQTNGGDQTDENDKTDDELAPMW